jgi:PIN domain nuclease of toxin-antitoxin system
MTYVLDASAILRFTRFTDKETGFERVRDLLMQAATRNIELLNGTTDCGSVLIL